MEKTSLFNRNVEISIFNIVVDQILRLVPVRVGGPALADPPCYVNDNLVTNCFPWVEAFGTKKQSVHSSCLIQ